MLFINGAGAMLFINGGPGAMLIINGSLGPAISITL